MSIPSSHTMSDLHNLLQGAPTRCYCRYIYPNDRHDQSMTMPFFMNVSCDQTQDDLKYVRSVVSENATEYRKDIQGGYEVIERDRKKVSYCKVIDSLTPPDDVPKYYEAVFIFGGDQIAL